MGLGVPSGMLASLIPATVDVEDVPDDPTTGAPAPLPAKPTDLFTGAAAGSSGLPSWYPAGFDLNAAAQAAAKILEAQGENPDAIGPGKARQVVFQDVDEALLRTSTPVMLKNKKTGEHLKDPDTGRLLLLNVGPIRDNQGAEMTKLKAKWPNVRWDDYAFDFREYGSFSELMRSKAIPATLGMLERARKVPDNREFVISARGDDEVPEAVAEKLKSLGIPADGVFAVNNPSQGAALGIGVAGLTSAQKKALAMAALLKLYDPAGSQVRRARFVDNTDDNLKAAVELLPRLFPDIQIEFVDVIYDGGTNAAPQYHLHVVAKTGQGGQLFDRTGKPITLDDVEAYASKDARHPPDPVFRQLDPFLSKP